MTNPTALYTRTIRAIQPAVNHAPTPNAERRYVVMVDGVTHYTDSAARVARLTKFGTVGTVTDRGER